jgi:hypothetical protein
MVFDALRKAELFTITIAAIMAMGCATSSRYQIADDLEAAGPGTIFSSVDAAAVDGLTYAYLTARQTGQTALAHGGTVVRVDGGFTYEELEVANKRSPMTLTLILRPHTVAQFRTYPRTDDPRVNRLNEKVSRSDRRNVDSSDPMHRPLFVLTPRLLVKSYEGGGDPMQEVANLGRQPANIESRTMLAGTSELFF